MAYFIPCHKCDDASNVPSLFVENVVKFYGTPQTIICHMDLKFLNHFWKELWGTICTKLLFFNFLSPTNLWPTEVVNRTLGSMLCDVVHRKLTS